jgi:glycosyltransferase involved in cell wall biosynthesis
MHREMYFAKGCIKAGIPFSIFFHGWDWAFSELLDSNSKLRSRYVKLINSSDNIFVLGLSFKDKLVSWGVNENKIYLEKTMVDDDFIPKNPNEFSDKKSIKLLFLSRVTKSKGIFQAVDAFNLHLQANSTSSFTIAGTGEDLEELREYVRSKNVRNINFVGFADDVMKRKLMSNHDVFILPSYSEGMPISIFEAMSYGLTVITRPVGGIPDYFVEGEMGFSIESLEPVDFAKALNTVVKDIDLRERVSFFNRKYILENVSSSVISNRLLSEFESHYEK